MLVYLNVFILILFNFQRPFSFTTFVVTFCFFVSHSSDSLSLSLGFDLVNNFFQIFQNSFKKGFYLISFNCLCLLATCFILTYKIIAIIIHLLVYLIYFYISLKYSFFLNHYIIDTLGFVIVIILIHSFEIIYCTLLVLNKLSA